VSDRFYTRCGQHRHRNGEVELGHAVAGSFEAFAQRLAREEVRVVAVEDPSLRVTEASEQQAQPHAPVRHVRRAQYTPAAGSQQRPNADKERLRVAQVLYEVATEDGVEAGRLEGQLHRLDVADVHRLAEAPSVLGRPLVHLKPDDGDSPSLQVLGEVARGAADVEHAT
jgi:hypothetical protein